jgi:hypothetical protein
MEDDAEVTVVEASEEEQQRLLQHAEERAAELAENLMLTMQGCEAWQRLALSLHVLPPQVLSPVEHNLHGPPVQYVGDVFPEALLSRLR